MLSALAPHSVGLTEAECVCAAPCGSAGHGCNNDRAALAHPSHTPYTCFTPPGGPAPEALRGFPAETAPASAGAAEAPADTGSDKDYRVD